MPDWGDILKEINEERARSGNLTYDRIRRKYLVLLSQNTGRTTVLYASKWTQSNPNIPPELISVTIEDVQGFMEVMHGIDSQKLDLLIHSPGGSLEAAEAIVTYLRSKFTHIRAIIPHAAMSAATIIACAADEIIMGKHSFLGPIDPQIILHTPLGPRAVPAQAILDQFERAKHECSDPQKLAAWVPMLNQYGPDLLVNCKNALDLSEELVRKWLTNYMFANESDRVQKADRLAKWLSNHSNFKTHGRFLDRGKLRAEGLNPKNLEEDQDLQDLVLSVFHATTQTFDGTGALKIIENNLGKCFVKLLQVQGVPFGSIPILQPMAPPATPSPDR